jgi:hypothetical protein
VVVRQKVLERHCLSERRLYPGLENPLRPESPDVSECFPSILYKLERREGDIDNARHSLRYYLTNTIRKFDAGIIGAEVERSSKLFDKIYASYIQ